MRKNITSSSKKIFTGNRKEKLGKDGRNSNMFLYKKAVFQKIYCPYLSSHFLEIKPLISPENQILIMTAYGRMAFFKLQ